MKKNIAFDYDAYEEYIEWSRLDKKIFKRINQLILDICRAPFSGLGKPEPLKYKLQGAWSRRITDEHRLVYCVTKNEIQVLSCKYHY